MRKYILIIAAILFWSSAIAADLTVVIKTLDSKEGQVMVGLFNSDNTFAKPGEEYQGKKIYPITSSVVTAKFDNIPAGEYAIAAFQDKNMTGKLAKNIFGVPMELYGFSNYNQSGKPNFDNAKFKVGTESLTITINLR